MFKPPSEFRDSAILAGWITMPITLVASLITNDERWERVFIWVTAYTILATVTDIRHRIR